MNLNEITENVWALCFDMQQSKRQIAAYETLNAIRAHKTYFSLGYKSGSFTVNNFRIAMPGDCVSVRRVGQVTENGYLRLMLSDSNVRSQEPTSCTCGSASAQQNSTESNGCDYCFWGIDSVSKYSIVREPSPMGYWTYDERSGSILFGHLGDGVWDGSVLLVEYISTEMPTKYPDDFAPIIVAYINGKSGKESPVLYQNLVREYKLARQPNLNPDAIAESARQPAWIKNL